MRIKTFLALAMLTLSNFAVADEIVFNHSKQTVGDFSCLPFSNKTDPQFDLESGVVSAGELWKFFDSRGSTSIHQLTLCLDLESLDDEASFGLQAIELKIEDPLSSGELLTDVSLGDNSIIVPGYETSPFRPEAKLELSLNYNFMERFSAESKEKISVSFKSNDEAIVPKFAFQSEYEGFFSGFRNPTILAGFSLSWIVIFYLLSRLTKPVADVVESSTRAVVNSRPSHGDATLAGESLQT